MKQFLATGIIKSTYGVKGFLKVRPYADDFSHFFKLKNVTLEKNGKQKEAVIEKVELHSGELIVKFESYDSPETARFISGWEIVVPRDQASKLEKGNIYIADLLDMKLMYDNEEIGTVVSTMEGAQALLLEVADHKGVKHIIPYIKGIYIDDVDIDKMTMRLLFKDLML